MNLYTQSASDLMVGTALIESNLGAEVVQHGGGPALGPFQMEPNTLDSLWENFIKYRPNLLASVKEASGVQDLKIDSLPDDDLLTENWYFAAAMCRVKYLDSPGIIPTFESCLNDPNRYAINLAGYYKDNYNTAKGACTLERAINCFRQIVGE
jgi:hypothetical protein